MDFALTEEQELFVKTTRGFVEETLYPHEEEVERTGELSEDIRQKVKARAQELGLYAFNMPEELGGGGLDIMSQTLVNRELGRANFALQYAVLRPSNILRACKGEQIDRYLLACIRGEKVDCLAMTEPGAGSDLRAMSSKAEWNGTHWVLNGQKHFISHADVADFAIVFAVTKVEDTPRGPRKLMTSFLLDKGTPGFICRRGPNAVSHRGYHQCEMFFDNVKLSPDQVLGEPHKGFDVANTWLGATRLEVAAMCLGRMQRAYEGVMPWAGSRKAFGQTIGRFQGVGFKLADMATDIELSELITFKTAWKESQGIARDEDFAMAKVVATEALARVADNAIQIMGGMGLMETLPFERIWRDARVERIWDGTSEIQRHIISRALLRPFES